MTPFWAILCGIAAGIVSIVLTRDILLIVWKNGYERGRKAEAEAWVKCGREADEDS